MKVLLIRPPHHHMITTNVPKSVDTETGMYPPLGLLYVAAGLGAWTDAEVELLDAPALHLDHSPQVQREKPKSPELMWLRRITQLRTSCSTCSRTTSF